MIYKMIWMFVALWDLEKIYHQKGGNGKQTRFIIFGKFKFKRNTIDALQYVVSLDRHKMSLNCSIVGWYFGAQLVDMDW